MKNRKFIFILCPPFQGSTIIVNLLDSSKMTSSFINTKAWAGESITLLQNKKKMRKKAWNKSNKFDFSLIKQKMDEHLDPSKKIFVEKSPPFINQAQLIQKYFSRYGEVYFIISIRNPYSATNSPTNWVKYAKYQKHNIETLNNTYVTSYEKLCNNLPRVIYDLKKKFPQMYDIKNQSLSQKHNKKNERYQQIHSDKVNRVINRSEKTRVLIKHKKLMDYFGYKILH